MPTVLDLVTDIDTALSGASRVVWSVQDAGTPENQWFPASVYVAIPSLEGSEVVDRGSNQTVVVVSATITTIYRESFTGDTANAVRNLAYATEELADPAFWAAMTSVRGEPRPVIEFAQDLERAGNTWSAVVRAEIALEA